MAARLKNIVHSVYIPDMSRADYVSWYKKHLNREPTKKEYNKRIQMKI